MNQDLHIILTQCEKQINHLKIIPVNDEYMNELDIFNGYFTQLKQLLKESDAKENKKRLKILKESIEYVSEKVQNKMKEVMQEINNIEKRKNYVGYGTQKITEAIKIDKRL